MLHVCNVAVANVTENKLASRAPNKIVPSDCYNNLNFPRPALVSGVDVVDVGFFPEGLN